MGAHGGWEQTLKARQQGGLTSGLRRGSGGWGQLGLFGQANMTTDCGMSTEGVPL